MPALISAPLDVIDELMYRCWARRNFLPPELREADWHPVILEEMAAKDYELLEESRRETTINQPPHSRFVPLVPTITHLVHPAHADLREPHYLTSPESAGGGFMDSIYAGGLYTIEL